MLSDEQHSETVKVLVPLLDHQNQMLQGIIRHSLVNIDCRFWFCGTLEEAQRILIEVPDIDWIIFDHCVPESSAIQFWNLNDDLPSLRFVKQVLNANSRIRAVMLWNGQIDHVHLMDRISPIERSELLDVKTISMEEIFNAGSRGYTLVPPTIVTLKYERERDVADSAILSLQNIDGPFEYHVRRHLDDGQRSSLKSRLTDFNALAEEFRHAHLEKHSKEMRKKQMIKSAKRLGLVLSESNLFSTLDRAIRDGIQRTWSQPNPNTLGDKGIYPFHIHILLGADVVAVPIDMSLPANSGNTMLNTVVPIVYRNTAPDDGHREPSIRKRNLVSYTRTRGVCSCACGFDLDGARVEAIESVEDHTLAILANIKSDLNTAHLVTDDDELERVLEECAKEVASSIYIITHGHHGFDGDSSVILLGPSRKSKPGVTVTPLRFNTYAHLRSLAFLYINCCEIGHLDAFSRSEGSIFSSFATSVIEEGKAREVVANRTSVDQSWAQKIAVEFFKASSISVHGRAVALTLARRAVRAEVIRAGDPNDMSWASPVHFWAQSRS